MLWQCLGGRCSSQVIEYMNKALALGQERREDRANCSIALGHAHMQRGHRRKALAVFEQALGVWREVFGPAHSHVAFAHTNVALAAAGLKDAAHTRTAIEHDLRAVDVYEHIHTDDREEAEDAPSLSQAIPESGSAPPLRGPLGSDPTSRGV